MAYAILAIILLALFIVAFVAERFELFAPAPLCCLGFSVSAFLAFLGTSSWNQIELSVSAAGVITVGCLSFCAASFATSRLISPWHGKTRSTEEVALPSSARLWKYAVVAAVVLIAIAVRVKETHELGAELGGSYTSYWDLAEAVRRSTESFIGAGNTEIGEGFSLISRQFDKVVRAIGFVGTFLLARGLNRRIETRREIIADIAAPLAMVGLCSAYILLCGSRATILYMGISGIVIWALMRLNRGSAALRDSLVMLGCCAIAAVIVAGVFYWTAGLLGRSYDSGAIDYISFYYGGGTPSLQYLMDWAQETGAHVDGKTFYTFVSFLFKFGLAGDPGSSSIMWIQLGQYPSNIFTAFGGPYFDFGIIGVIALGVVAGAFTTTVYRLARRTASPYLIVLVGYLSGFVFDMARCDFMFSKLISVNQLLVIILMLLVLWFFEAPLSEMWRAARMRVRGGDKS